MSKRGVFAESWKERVKAKHYSQPDCFLNISSMIARKNLMVCEERYLHEPLTSIASTVFLVLDDGASPRLRATDSCGNSMQASFTLNHLAGPRLKLCK